VKLCNISNGNGYGVVLEGDATFEFVDYWNASLLNIMESVPDAVVFNLGTAPLVDERRMDAIVAGKHFIPTIWGDWGTVAVGYKLESVCQASFFDRWKQLRDCVPVDLSLYANNGKPQAPSYSATVPFFGHKCSNENAHSDDETHRDCQRTRRDNLRVWKRGLGPNPRIEDKLYGPLWHAKKRVQERERSANKQTETNELGEPGSRRLSKDELECTFNGTPFVILFLLLSFIFLKMSSRS
jgi:hypothetical protein